MPELGTEQRYVENLSVCTCPAYVSKDAAIIDRYLRQMPGLPGIRDAATAPWLIGESGVAPSRREGGGGGGQRRKVDDAAGGSIESRRPRRQGTHASVPAEAFGVQVRRCHVARVQSAPRRDATRRIRGASSVAMIHYRQQRSSRGRNCNHQGQGRCFFPEANE